MDMATILSIFILIGLVFLSAFYQFSLMLWTTLIGAVIISFSLIGFLSGSAAIVVWFIYLLVVGFTQIKSFRIRFLVKPLFSYLQKKLPPISSTEKAAIEAGDTWWEKELFCGRPDWHKLLALPRPSLSLEEQAFLDNQVEELCNMVNEWEMVHHDLEIPDKILDYLKKEKFFAIVIPKNYGGLGFSAYAHSTIITKIATRSVSVAVTTMVPNSLGPSELLLRYGTEAQKNHYLPRLADGSDIPCFALTAPEAGSDAGGMPDVGIIKRGQFDGKEMIGIELNWNKRYITLAPVATLLGLAVQLYDPDHLLGEKEALGITLCLIPTNHPGVETGTRHYPMYAVFMNGPTRGNQVFIPLDWIIGGIEKAGQGWRMLMECLSVGRSISLPALSTACGKMVYRLTGAYARIRQQFNTSLSSFEGIEEALAYIGGYTYLIEACRIMTVSAVDMDINPSIVSAIAKYHMTEMGRKVVSLAMDIHAGHMIQVGPRNPLASAYLATPISITVEGANILTRNLIIFGQGAIRCHPYLLKEIELLNAENADLPEFDKILFSHLGFLINHLFRGIAYGITNGNFISTPFKNKKINRVVKQLTRMSNALALLADISFISLGGSLKRKERTSARLGDILSYLYLASTVLKYYYDHQKPYSDENYVVWGLEYCLHQAQQSCQLLLNNYPKKWIGKIFKWLLFPYGFTQSFPKDTFHSKLAASMTTPNELRERLTRYIHIKDDSLIAQLDEAIEQIADIEPLLKKFKKGLEEQRLSYLFNITDKVNAAVNANIITLQEGDRLLKFYALKDEITKVNEFNFDLTEVLA